MPPLIIPAFCVAPLISFALSQSIYDWKTMEVVAVSIQTGGFDVGGCTVGRRDADIILDAQTWLTWTEAYRDQRNEVLKAIPGQLEEVRETGCTTIVNVPVCVDREPPHGFQPPEEEDA